MIVALLTYVVPQVVGGVVPAWYLGGILEPWEEWPSGFAFWHHLDAALVVSLTAFTVGTLLYLFWRRAAALPMPPGAVEASGGIARGTLGFARWFSRAVQAGGHPRYISVTLVATAAAVIAMVWPMVEGPLRPGVMGPDFDLAWLPTVAIVGAALLLLVMPRRIPKVVMMSVIGYGMAVYYVIYRAPDLALTQLLVETVSLLLLLLTFRRMPELERDPRPGSQRFAHGAVAALTGITMGAITWYAGIYDAPDKAGTAQLALSYPEAAGRNVVNVILVDFRGVDTMGEIGVLAIAALGAVALLKSMRRPDAEQQAAAAAPTSVGEEVAR